MKQHIDPETYYRQKIKKARLTTGLSALALLIAFTVIAFIAKAYWPFIFCFFIWIALAAGHYQFNKKYYRRLKLIHKTFPASWKQFLDQHVPYYHELNESDRRIFNLRVSFFISEKRIEGIDTEVTDTDKLLVASSAIIPTFAFPFFEYPNVDEVLLYPNSFDEKFQTARYEGHSENILGMVGDRYLNNTVILSKPDLINAFNGTRNKHNVGIHEFVHLLDMADGATDGIPEILLDRNYVLPWLKEIKSEIHRIEKGHSDINPYGLTNNAEFLSVVSEYFFDNPHEFHKKHPELYEYLTTIFHQHLD